MALTLIEAAKLNQGEVLRAGVINVYASSTDLLRVLPFADIPGNALRYNQEETLPGIGFRGVNESYTESTGVLNPVVEPLVIGGGDVDVDKFITRTMGEGQRSAQEAMKIKALAHKWAHVFIKGDSTTEPREYDGLQTRLTGNQVVSNSAASGGAGLSLAKLDEAIDAVDEAQYLLMSKATRRLLTTAARNTSVGGTINYTLDEFGRRVTVYNDLPILIADPNGAAFATLAFDEAYTGGGTANGTSVYVLSFGEDKLAGIQNGAIDVTDLGELQSKPSMRTRIEWYAGISMYHPRAACRLRDIKNAAVTA